MANNWWIDIDLKVSAPTVEVVESRTVQIWEWRKKYQRKSTLRTRTYTETKTLNLASVISEIIANRIADHMIEYAPIDESDNKDDIVLKKNIRATEVSAWNFVVWSDLPYATRRNYENNLNPDTKFYVENSYQNHESEYDKIAQEIVDKYVDNCVAEMIANLNRSSWAKKSTNWGSESFKL